MKMIVIGRTCIFELCHVNPTHLWSFVSVSIRHTPAMALMEIFTLLRFLSQNSWISSSGKQLPIHLPFVILPEEKKNLNVKVDMLMYDGAAATLKMYEIKLYYNLCSGSHTLLIQLLQCASVMIVVQIFSHAEDAWGQWEWTVLAGYTHAYTTCTCTCCAYWYQTNRVVQLIEQNRKSPPTTTRPDAAASYIDRHLSGSWWPLKCFWI